MQFMEAETSQDLLSISWRRPSKASGVVQSKAKGLRTGEVEGLSFNPRAPDQCASSE